MRKSIRLIIFVGMCFALISCNSENSKKEAIQNPKNKNAKVQKPTKADKAISEESNVNQKDSQLSSKQLFEKAIDLQRKNGFFLSTSKDTQVYINSAELMEKAISLDSSNVNYRVNLAKVYFKLDSNEKALDVFNEILLIKPDYVEAVTSKGFILEKLGNITDAKKSYQKALKIYGLRTDKTYGDYINMSFLVLLLEGKEEALKELSQVKNKFPDKDITVFKNQFENFDRKEFINKSLR